MKNRELSTPAKRSRPMGSEKERTPSKICKSTSSTQPFYGDGTPSLPVLFPVIAPSSTPHPYVSGNQGPILAIHEDDGKMFRCGDTGSVTIGGENVASVSGNYGASKSAAFGMKDSFDASDDKITHDFFPTKKQSYDKLIADDAQNKSTSQYSDANPVSAVKDLVVLNPKIDLTLRISLDAASTEPAPLKVEPIEYGFSPPPVASAMKGEPIEYGFSPPVASAAMKGEPIEYGFSPPVASAMKDEPIEYGFSPPVASAMKDEPIEYGFSPPVASALKGEPIEYGFSPPVASAMKDEPNEYGFSPPVASAMKVEPCQEAKHEEGIQDEHKMEMEGRLANRETVGRSRLRMQQEENENFETTIKELNLENYLLSEELNRVSDKCMKLNCENKSLMEELTEAYGPDAVPDLVTKHSSISQPRKQ